MVNTSTLAYLDVPDATVRNHARPPTAWSRDPLSADSSTDEAVVTTAKRLIRLMITAVDVGARFERERTGHDAATWMLAPRRMFDGRPAIEACQDLRGCLRATVLHGLGLGLDADPEALDELLEDEPDDACDVPAGPLDRRNGPRLLSAWVDMSGSSRPAVHFCAMVTADPTAFARRLVERFGPDGAAAAEVEVGFDPTSARATAFISEAMSQTLVLAAASPASPFSAGLDVIVEQRFAA